ncbi:MAG: type IV secretion system protein [Acidobacteriota bacterium]
MDGILKSLINSFGDSILPFSKKFFPFAGSIFLLMIVFEFIKEATNIVTGKGINLAAKLLLILFVGTLILRYDEISTGIYNTAEKIGSNVINEFGNLWEKLDESYQEGVMKHKASLETHRDNTGWIEWLFSKIVIAILTSIAVLILFFIIIYILVMIAGVYASLALVLALGPVFIAMFVSEELRSMGVRWALIVLSYLLTLPIYLIVFQVIIDLSGRNIYNGLEMSSSATIEQIILLLVGPLIALGLMFSVSDVVAKILGSAGNAGESAIRTAFSMALVASMALKGASKLAGKAGRSSANSPKQNNTGTGRSGRLAQLSGGRNGNLYKNGGNSFRKHSREGNTGSPDLGSKRSDGPENHVAPPDIANPPRVSGQSGIEHNKNTNSESENE